MNLKLNTKVILYTLLILICVIVVFPIVYAISGSFKTNMELMAGTKILPEQLNFNNYIKVWQEVDFAKYTANSIVIAISSTAIAIFISSLAAYCLERNNFPGKKLLYSVYLSTMFIALGAVVLRPLYLLAVSVGLQNTLIPIILILVGSQGVNIFLVTRFIKSIPKELDESAMIDGCTPFQIYSKIILPLLKPILAVVGLFQFRIGWNDYITSSVFTMTAPELRPLTVGIVQLKYGATAAMEWNLMMTGAAIAIIPMLLIYAIANKQFMSGAMEGAVKG